MALGPLADDLMKAVPVNRAVNSVKNDDERCIAPVGLPDREANGWAVERLRRIAVHSFAPALRRRKRRS
jgi:hypothetical protein